MIELKNISFIKDNKKILDTKFYALTGPNGSGKSTLAKIIMGLIEPTSGSILYNGEDITNKNITERANMGIAFAFQQPVKFKGITVFDLLKFAMNKDINRMDACKYLAKVGLCAKDYVDREIDNSLSGGELKRIEIASILARNPKVVIFDEPEAGIDLWSFKALNNIFKELEKTNNGVTLVITHQERILDIADEIILLENGKISKIGSKDEMMPLIVTSECCGVVNNE